MIATFMLLSALSADATVVSVIGKVELQAGSEPRVLVRFAPVPEGATVITYEQAFAAIRFPDGSMLRMGEKTRVTLGKMEQHEPAARRDTRIKLAAGKVWARVMDLFGKGSRFELETPNAVAGVRGTAFFAETGDAGDTYTVDTGAINLLRGDSSLDLAGAGAFAHTNGQGFTPPARLSPSALAELRLGVSGVAGSLIESLRQHGSPEHVGDSHASLRDTLNGPDHVADSPVSPTGSGDQIRGAADVKVQIRMPSQP